MAIGAGPAGGVPTAPSIGGGQPAPAAAPGGPEQAVAPAVPDGSEQVTGALKTIMKFAVSQRE